MTAIHSSRAKRICTAYFTVIVLSFLVSLTQIDPRLFPGDFISFYAAGHLLASGDGSQMYDVARQAELQEQLLADTGRSMNGAVIKFLYPAALGVFFVPFSTLPLLLSYFLWTLAGIAFLVGSTHLVPRKSGEAPASLPVLALAEISFFPILECLLQGQTSLLFLFFFACFYALFQRGHPFGAGLMLGLSFLKPQLPALLFLLLLLHRRWRAVSGVLVCGAVLVGISVLVVGPSQFLAYPSTASQLLDDPGIRVDLMPNLHGTVVRLSSWLGTGLQGAGTRPISILLSLLCLGLFLPGWMAGRTSGEPVFPILIAQAIVLGLMFSPHLFAYDLAVVLIPFLILFSEVRSRKHRRQLLQVALLGHMSAFFLNFLVPKTWLEQILFLWLGLIAWFTLREARDRQST